MIDRRPPTHVLTVTVPLHFDDGPGDGQAVKDAIGLALTISRAAYTGAICDDPQVTLVEAGA